MWERPVRCLISAVDNSTPAQAIPPRILPHHIRAFLPDHDGGALVLPETTVGMMEQSAAQPGQALDPQAGIDDGAVVGGHAARAGRVEDGAAALARELQQVVVGLMIVLRFALQF